MAARIHQNLAEVQMMQCCCLVCFLQQLHLQRQLDVPRPLQAGVQMLTCR